MVIWRIEPNYYDLVGCVLFAVGTVLRFVSLLGFQSCFKAARLNLKISGSQYIYHKINENQEIQSWSKHFFIISFFVIDAEQKISDPNLNICYQLPPVLLSIRHFLRSLTRYLNRFYKLKKLEYLWNRNFPDIRIISFIIFWDFF